MCQRLFRANLTHAVSPLHPEFPRGWYCEAPTRLIESGFAERIARQFCPVWRYADGNASNAVAVASDLSDPLQGLALYVIGRLELQRDGRTAYNAIFKRDLNTFDVRCNTSDGSGNSCFKGEPNLEKGTEYVPQVAIFAGKKKEERKKGKKKERKKEKRF
jgi:hypothetical protein